MKSLMPGDGEHVVQGMVVRLCWSETRKENKYATMAIAPPGCHQGVASSMQ
jgi:hypothetical protein